MLPAQELPGTTHASLYLIADHYQVLLITPLAYTLHKLRRARPDTTLALYCLDQDADCLLACCRLQCLYVVKQDLFETVSQGNPGGLVMCLPSCRSRRQCAPLKAALHTDDFIGTVPMKS